MKHHYTTSALLATSLSLVAIFLLSTTPTLTHAQQPNWRATPNYGTISLSSGFTPDPQRRSVRAGGSSSIPISNCSGYINMGAPDLDLNYQSGSYTLSIEAEPDTDVTLLVYTPNGEWMCDDDSGEGTNARLTFSSPQSGNYNIWVGTYSSGAGTPNASVMFTEMSGSGTTSNTTSRV